MSVSAIYSATTPPTPPSGASVALLEDANGNLRITDGWNFVNYSTSSTGPPAPVITVPAGKKWRIKGGLFSSNTSAVSGTRNFILVAGIPGSNLYNAPSPVNVPASNGGWQWSFGPGNPASTVAVIFGIFYLPFPELSLVAGNTLAVQCFGADTADVVHLLVNVEEMNI